jgi:5-methylcytosine-specific restriction endonuclease McrA
MKMRGKKYALNCSWKNRAETWSKLLFLGESTTYELKTDFEIIQNDKTEQIIRNLYTNSSCKPRQEHTDFLIELSKEFTPKIIYDIGANVLHWTREAQNIWNDCEVCVFDAIKTAEFLYKEKKLN